MKYSQLFGKTLRKVTKQMKSKGYSLLLKGGFIQPLGKGLYTFLPLGLRVIENIKKIMKEELDQLGGQEIQIPMVNPYEIWKYGGRLGMVEKELIRFSDRDGKDLVLAPSHEEAMVITAKARISSYRDLPIFLYEFQDKFRDEERCRCGLVRTKEFLMKDAYSFHRSYTDLNNFFPKVFAAYERIFNRVKVPFISAEAGVGYIGGEKAYEFLMPVEYGDDTLIECTECGYAGNKEVAVGVKESGSEAPKTLEVVKTPNCTTMDDLSAFLEVPKSKLVKSMVYSTSSGYVMALVRGDYDVSLEKLSKAIGQPVLGKPTKKEMEAARLVPGYLSPINLQIEMPVIIDDTVANSSNLVLGTNEEGRHYINVNFGRDFETERVADIARIKQDNYCLQCGHILSERPVMELGNIFKLGQAYTKQFDLGCTDETGEVFFPHMGAYGIGVGRLMVAIAEENRDSRGIVWPPMIAPYKVFLMGIGKSFRVREVVERLHTEFPNDILCDDRDESPGVKFKDADLIGMPLRVVVSSKNLQDGNVEFHDRKTDETWLVPIDKIEEMIEIWR